jgi:pimeloyl-ACP methyl ester carboxylesterase
MAPPPSCAKLEYTARGLGRYALLSFAATRPFFGDAARLPRSSDKIVTRILLRTVLAGAVIVAALWLSHPDIPRAAVEARWLAPPSRFIEVADGTRVHVRERGPSTAPPLVLVHGSTDSLFTWEPWSQALSNEFRVVTLDLPGHGLTGAVPSGDYSEEAMVWCLLQVADALALPPFALGGNSMGGRVAARFTEEHSERVTKLILVDAGGMGVSANTWKESLVSFAQSAGAARLYRLAPRWLVNTGINQVVVRTEAFSEERRERFWDFNHMAGTPEATLRRYQSPGSHMREHLSEIGVPTLILWGAEDSVVPVDAGRKIQSSILGSRLVVFPNVGHLPQEEVAEESAAEARRFLDADAGGTDSPR